MVASRRVDEVSFEPYVTDPAEAPRRAALADATGSLALAAVVLFVVALTYLIIATQLRQDPTLEPPGGDRPAAGSPADPAVPQLDQEAPPAVVGGTEGDVVVPGAGEPTPFAVPEAGG